LSGLLEVAKFTQSQMPNSRTGNTAQWQWLLGSLARVWSTVYCAESLRLLMTEIGSEYAKTRPLPSATLLTDIEKSINELWFEMHWGTATFSDLGSVVHIEHQGAPLDTAFGPNALKWSVGLLEGMYGTWLRDAGAGDDLELRHVESPMFESTGGALEFVLSARAGR
jgi:hypothetical protein